MLLIRPQVSDSPKIFVNPSPNTLLKLTLIKVTTISEAIQKATEPRTPNGPAKAPVLPEMATGRQRGDFWSFLGDKIFEIDLLNGDFSRENLLSDGDFSANLI